MNTDSFMVCDAQVVRIIEKRFSLLRALVALVTLTLLLVTNPANQVPLEVANFLDGLQIPTPPSYNEQDLTNYGIFALEHRNDGIWIHGLYQSHSICQFSNVLFGSICSKSATEMCHHHPLFWNSNDLPFSVCRILTVLLILSGITSWIGISIPSSFTIIRHPSGIDFVGLLNIYHDLIKVYQLLSTRTMLEDTWELFLLNSFFLVVTLGTIGNQLAGCLMDGRNVTGLSGGAVGATMAYASALKSSKLNVHNVWTKSWEVKELSRFYYFGTKMAQMMYWVQFATKFDAGRTVSFAIGAMGGCMLGQNYVENRVSSTGRSVLDQLSSHLVHHVKKKRGMMRNTDFGSFLKKMK